MALCAIDKVLVFFIRHVFKVVGQSSDIDILVKVALLVCLDIHQSNIGKEEDGQHIGSNVHAHAREIARCFFITQQERAHKVANGIKDEIACSVKDLFGIARDIARDGSL